MAHLQPPGDIATTRGPDNQDGALGFIGGARVESALHVQNKGNASVRVHGVGRGLRSCVRRRASPCAMQARMR